MEKVSRAVTALVVVAALVVVVAGCGGSSAATPVHQVNVFFDGLSHNDYRQTCSVVKGFPSEARCEQYFTVNAAITGGGLTGHAVAHSEKIAGDKATVRGVDSAGTRYVASLERGKSGVWKIASVASA